MMKRVLAAAVLLVLLMTAFLGNVWSQNPLVYWCGPDSDSVYVHIVTVRRTVARYINGQIASADTSVSADTTIDCF